MCDAKGPATVWGAFIAVLFLSQSGCTGAPNPRARILELNSSNIVRMRSCCTIYSPLNGKPPRDEKSFRNFFENEPSAGGRLKRIGVEQENFDSVFTSERDGQPFVVRWGTNGAKDAAIIFEAEGVDGKLMVAFDQPRKLEDHEHEEYLSGQRK